MNIMLATLCCLGTSVRAAAVLKVLTIITFTGEDSVDG
jgi:hypothetical protein